MKTPEQIETEKKAKDKRDRRIFYLGMSVGMALTFIMVLVNRL